MPLPVSVAKSVKATPVVLLYWAPLFIVIVPVGGVVSIIKTIESLTALDQLPALSLNLTYTYFVPAPLVSVQFLVVAYVSAADHAELLFENCIWDTPETASVAERFNVTLTELVDAALLFIEIVPVGKVVSRVMALE